MNFLLFQYTYIQNLSTLIKRYYFVWCFVIIFENVPPVHRLSRKELQLIMIKAEAVEGEKPSKCFRGQVVQGIIAETEPLYIVQALVEIPDHFREVLSNTCS